MGRLQHLERLALGRSPFQDAASEAERRADEAETGDNDQQTPWSDGQQYDSKGRPINPAAEERNQAMRKAQNAVLLLVGVVENTDALSRELEVAARQVQQLKARLLDAEQDRGEVLNLLATLLHSVSTWWSRTLTYIVQAGLFAGSMSFTNVLQSQVDTARLVGTRGLVSMLLQGLPAWILFNTLKTLTCAGIGEAVSQLQQMLNKRMSRKSMKQVNRLIRLSCEVIPIVIDAVFLPLQYVAFSQSLGLASAWPPLSNWRLLLPWNRSRLQSIVWNPTYGTSAVASLTSPAAIMLLKNFLERDQGDGLPIAQQFTSFEWPAINAPSEVVRRMRAKLYRDPLGQVLYQCYLARTKAMTWLGWDLEYMIEHPDQETKYQNNRALPPRFLSSQQTEHGAPGRDSRAWAPRYRSTSLAHQPAQYLADCMDDFCTRLLMFPIDSLVVRTITQSYVLSGLPRTNPANEASLPMYLPFGGGPLNSIRTLGFSGSAWREMGNYTNRLGLSLALTCVGEVGVFFVVYGLCRWQGVETFDWGDARRNRQHRVKDACTPSADGPVHQNVATGELAEGIGEWEATFHH